MNILLTGSNGFIGRAIAASLTDENRILGLGRQKENQCPDVKEYVCADLSEEAALEPLRGRKLDVMIHAAANLNMASDDPRVLQDNCMGTFHLTRLAVQTGCSRFLYLSSLPVVGTPKPEQDKALTEATLPRPETVYHASKLMGEHLVSLLWKEGISAASLRIPSPIGAGMSERTIFSVFLRQAAAGETITLRGKGTRKQNYVDVRDIAEAVKGAVYAEKLSECYQITAAETISNTELARRCIEALHSSSSIRYEGEDPGDGIDWRADGSLAEKELHFVPRYQLEDTIAWMQSENR